MNYEFYLLPLTSDPWQVMVLDLPVSGAPLHARLEVRYLPAANRWFFSLWDHASGELLVNQVPLVCSREAENDLLAPFRHLRGGKGVGALFCTGGPDGNAGEDPTEKNLTDYQVLFCGNDEERGDASRN